MKTLYALCIVMLMLTSCKNDCKKCDHNSTSTTIISENDTNNSHACPVTRICPPATICPEVIPCECEVCPVIEITPPIPVGHMVGRIIWGEEWKEHDPYSSANYIAVKVVGEDESWERSTITDDDGHFDIELIADSNFRLFASNGNSWAEYNKTILGVVEGGILERDPCLDAGPDMVDCS